MQTNKIELADAQSHMEKNFILVISHKDKLHDNGRIANYYFVENFPDLNYFS